MLAALETLQIGDTANWIDVIVLIVLALFLIYGIVRGFMLQLLGVGVLVGAIILACLLSAPVGSWLAGKWEFPKPEMPRYVAFATVFLLTLMLGMFMARRLKGVMEKAKVLAYDRLLGAVVGLVKGVLLVVIIINLAGYFWLPEENQPAEGMSKAVLESQTMGFSKWTTGKVLVFLPDDMRNWLEDRSIVREEEDADVEPERDPEETKE
jgi:membrane protein required for colicin V production